MLSLSTRAAASGRSLEAVLAQAVTAAAAAAADIVAEEARRSLAEPSPPVSAPGSPPGRRSGSLRASVSARALSNGTAAVVAHAPHAAALEFGTRTMAARPFLQSAALGIRGAAREAAARAFERALAQARRAAP